MALVYVYEAVAGTGRGSLLSMVRDMAEFWFNVRNTIEAFSGISGNHAVPER